MNSTPKRRFVVSSTPASKQRATLETVKILEQMNASSETVELAKGSVAKRFKG